MPNTHHQPNQYRHIAVKLGDALEWLATNKGDARERVAKAYLYYLIGIKESDLPPRCRQDWKWIVKEITKLGPGPLDHKGEHSSGSVEYTMSRVRKATGAKIAKKIVDLYWAVSENSRSE